MSHVAWGVYALWSGAIVTTGAWLAARAAAALGRSARWIWLAAAGLTLALPLLSFVPAARGRPAVTVFADWPELAATVPLASGEPVAESSLLTVVDRAAPLVWKFVVAVALIWVGVSHWRLGRLRRAWDRTTLAGRAVAVSPDFGPAVVGVVRPEIVVPRWIMALAPAQQAMVLDHEGHHLAHHDSRLLAALILGIIVMPGQPFLWLQLAGLRLAIELDCDRRVLRQHPRRDYAELLLGIAGRVGRTRGTMLWGLPLVALWPHRSQLERRIGEIVRGPLGRAQAVACRALLILAVGLIAVACATRPPAAPAPEVPDGGRGPSEAEAVAAALARYFPRPTRLHAPGQMELYWLVTERDGRMVRTAKGLRPVVWRDGDYYRRNMPAMFAREQARADSAGRPGPAVTGVFVLGVTALGQGFPDLANRTPHTYSLGPFPFGADTVMVVQIELEPAN